MSLNPDDYTVVQLKKWLKNLNLKTSGNKSELILRLNEVPVDERGDAPEDGDESHMVDILPDISDNVINHKANNKNDEEISIKNREIDILKREKNLLEREISLLHETMRRTTPNIDNVVLNNSSANQIPLTLIKEIIPPYSGDTDFEFWSTQIKNVRDSYVVDENWMRAVIVSKLTDKALHWFHTNIYFAKMDLDTMLKQMGEIFGRRDNKLVLRKRFESRIWKVGENFSEYYNAKMTLSSGLNIDESELVDYLIEGVPDENLRTQAFLQCYDSKLKLLQAFSRLTLKPPTKSALTSQKRPAEIRCYNCNLLGHYASDCKKTKREYGSCFGCGSKSHMVAACPERRGQIGLLEENEFTHY